MANCGQILQQGIFNSTVIHSSSQMEHDFYQFVYASDWDTHDQAIDAGIQIGVPVYGIPLQIGGNFTKQQKDTWRSENAQYQNDHLTVSQKYDLITKQVDQSIVRAWLECINTTAGQRPGLTAKFDDSVPEAPILTINWIPLAGDTGGLPNVNSSSIFGGTRIDGQTIIYPEGYTIKEGIDSNKLALRRNAHDVLIISLSTTRGDAVLTLLPHQDKPVIKSFSFNPSTILLGHPTKLSCDVQNVETVTIAPNLGVRPISGQEDVTPQTDGDITYTLTATNDSGTLSISTNLHVNHRPRLNGIAATINTTDDNKDGDTSFGIDVYAGGRHIGSYAWNYNGQDWEFGDNTSVTIGVPVVDAAYQDEISGAPLSANVWSRPNGSDDWHYNIGPISLSYN